MHVNAENQYCTQWNSIQLDNINEVLYTYVTHDVPKDQNTNLSNLTFLDNIRQTGNLMKTLNVKVGARVMLTTNINVADTVTQYQLREWKYHFI